MIWFYLDGEDSRDYGIYLMVPPPILSAEPDIEFINVPGRDGSLTLDHGGFKDADIDMECYIKNVSRIGEAYGFMSGNKKMVISTNPNRSYKAVFYRQAQSEHVVRNMNAQSMIVPVRLKPFRYFEPAPKAEKITTSGTGIINPGSARSAPRITINGSGNIAMMIGQYTMEFVSVSSGIIIDSDARQLLNIDGITKALKQDIEEFPLLEPGMNYVQWTGNIESIEIEPRWRDR